jgi:hypothetical protein
MKIYAYTSLAISSYEMVFTESCGFSEIIKLFAGTQLKPRFNSGSDWVRYFDLEVPRVYPSGRDHSDGRDEILIKDKNRIPTDENSTGSTNATNARRFIIICGSGGRKPRSVVAATVGRHSHRLIVNTPCTALLFSQARNGIVA